MNRHYTTGIAVLIITAGISIAGLIVATRPKAERKKPPRMTPVVEVKTISRSNRTATLDLMGQVVPAEYAELKARVPGQIVYAHPDWIEGGILKKDETVIKIDKADYVIALEQARSALELEKGRQDIAKHEWKLLKLKSTSDADRSLALREPQMKNARAKVEQARLNLERTEIKAPFSAMVTRRNMNTGDQATTQTSLGRIVNTQRYHVLVSVPVRELKWIVLPENGSKGSEALISLPDGSERLGHVIKLLGDLEEKGRMARCIVEIKDPVSETPPVLLNSFVKVRIKGKAIKDAYSIERQSFREDNKIWLLTKDNRLKTMKIQPQWSNRTSIIFKADVPDDHMLITSSLSMVIEGMELRKASDVVKKKSAKRGRK